jgi:acetyl-CoA carboxylase carboxyl transferase subunit alpha
MATIDKINVPDFERPIVELEIRLDELTNTIHLVRNDEEREAKEEEIADIKKQISKLVDTTYSNLRPWHIVQLARHPKRPLFTDHVNFMCDDWLELHGDRAYGDDPAIACGFASISGHKVMLMGHRKGKTLQERVKCNFGCPHPEGYRKAIQKMRLAEKAQLPIVTLINTPGAYPGVEAEERGQSMAIAEAIREMSGLKVPIVCATIGEGGSGGALGIGVGDSYLIMQHSYYSVISPEGCAAILWHDGKRAEEASEVLKLTPEDTVRLGVMDEVVPEPEGGAHRDPRGASELLRDAIVRHLEGLKAIPLDQMMDARYRKLRKMGEWKIV